MTDFWKSAGGAALIGTGASLLGRKTDGINYTKWDRMRQATLGDTQANLRLGNSLDLANQKKMFDYRIEQGVEAGMTPYEMYMGPAAGAGGGTSGSGAVLGNAASSMGQAAAQAEAQAKLQQSENNKNRITQLTQTAMQVAGQRDVAKINAGVQERGQDITALIEGNKLALQERQLEEIAIPDLANKTNLTEQQVKIAINEAANTDPKWIRKKTIMQLGVDNGIQNLILGRLNLDLTDPKQIQSLSDSQYADALAALLSASSAVGKNTAAVESILDRIFKTLKNSESNNSRNFSLDKLRNWFSSDSTLGKSKPHDSSEVPRVLGNKGPVPAGTPKYKNFNRDFPNR